MRARALTSLLFTALPLAALAQIQYHPLEVGGKPDKTKPKSVKLAAWSPKPSFSARLAPEKALFGWAIRPPKGFVATQKMDSGNQIYIFQGDPRQDNSAPMLWVVLGGRRNEESKKPQEEVLMDMYMIQLHQNRDNWKPSPVEYGTIQGRKFIRFHWSATEKIDQLTRHIHGAVYITLLNNGYAAVTLQDSDPGAKSTLDLMESSLLTFHKR
ncbi:MAG: hypothetical protein JWN14_3492 [Chthonomonadales bacterium]|nr:hypothetical protein [Chthonomonadales bacterium]